MLNQYQIINIILIYSMLKSDIFHHIFTFNIETTRKSGLKQDFAGISISINPLQII